MFLKSVACIRILTVCLFIPFTCAIDKCKVNVLKTDIHILYIFEKCAFDGRHG